jgi:uncharacterized protein YjaZ
MSLGVKRVTVTFKCHSETQPRKILRDKKKKKVALQEQLSTYLYFTGQFSLTQMKTTVQNKASLDTNRHNVAAYSKTRSNIFHAKPGIHSQSG